MIVMSNKTSPEHQRKRRERKFIGLSKSDVRQRDESGLVGKDEANLKGLRARAEL